MAGLVKDLAAPLTKDSHKGIHNFFLHLNIFNVCFNIAHRLKSLRFGETRRLKSLFNINTKTLYWFLAISLKTRRVNDRIDVALIEKGEQRIF